MFALQVANRTSLDYASMMWVPPWGLAVAVPVGALPVGAAQLIWVYGQFALILVLAVVLWRFYGGPTRRAWVAAMLALSFGPLWWQTICGQYAGLMLLGLVGFLAALRANRPVLAGACLFLIALKPHLFALFAVGLVIDALRTSTGRRVLLGGAAALAVAAGGVTLVNPGVWEGYAAAAGGGSTAYYRGLADWFNPTLQSWLRQALPGRPFWVQFVPLAFAAPAFAAYWWRHGRPDRWPDALPCLVPVGLLVAPYGGWPSDLAMLLLPLVWVACRLNAARWTVPHGRVLLGVYGAANIGLVAMLASRAALQNYVWAAPVLCGCLAWAYFGTRQMEATDARDEAELICSRE
jgi:hypothetical protein